MCLIHPIPVVPVQCSVRPIDFDGYLLGFTGSTWDRSALSFEYIYWRHSAAEEKGARSVQHRRVSNSVPAFDIGRSSIGYIKQSM